MKQEALEISGSLQALIGTDERSVQPIEKDARYLDQVLDLPVGIETCQKLCDIADYLGVTARFRDVIDSFQVPAGETPAGFRLGYVLDKDRVVRVDLIRDISCDRNGRKRPTSILFSADSANPYEVAPVSNMLANLTCNPGIIYDLFINNPKANVGAKFKTRDEVMEELGRVLGPGVDISVELNNPFEPDFEKILEEVSRFREMLSPYRVVIKVPHTGSVNAENVHYLLEGNKRFPLRADGGSTEDRFRGHNLALRLKEHGYRVNFTLMFEPYQAAMALQARPYFINSFVRHRAHQSATIRELLDLYATTDDPSYLLELREFLLSSDYLSSGETDFDLLETRKLAEHILKRRRFMEHEGSDGLDSVRHNLRILRGCNMNDTRLIICSMEGENNYPDILNLLTEPEFIDMNDRVVITAEPQYLAKFTSCNQVVSYQRRFMNAAKGEK
jgi:hypothetical protein